MPAPPPVPVAPAVAAPDPERLAIAAEIVRIGYPDADREQLFFGSLDAMLAQMRGVFFAQIQNDPGAAAIINRKLDGYVVRTKTLLRAHIPSLMDAMARAYAREFSKDELLQLRAFVATPLGQHYFLRSSSILRDPDFAAANVAYMRALQPEIERMRDELMTELKAYFMAHPPKAASES